MKLVFAVLMILLMLSASVAASFILSHLTDNGSNSAMQVPSGLAVVENIPLYPSAQGVSNVPFYAVAPEPDAKAEPPVGWRKITFRTSDENSAVIAFYKKVLPERGWVLVREYEYHPGLAFSLTAGENGPPWNMDLSIGFEGLAGRETAVTLLLSRWPDPTKIPLYSDAEQETVQYLVPDEETRFPVRVTTYSTTTSREEIERFYHSALPEAGWIFEDEHVSAESEIQLLFVYLRVGEKLDGGNLYVTIKTGSEGKTMVELRVRGDGIELPTQQQK